MTVYFLIEPCHNYKSLWEIRTIFNGFLWRELFGFDGEHNRVVLLHGYVKRVGQPASLPDLTQASDYKEVANIGDRRGQIAFVAKVFGVIASSE